MVVLNYHLVFSFAKNMFPCLRGTYLHSSLVNSSGTPSHTDTHIHCLYCYIENQALYCSHQCLRHIRPHLSHTGYQSRMLGTCRYQWSGHMTDHDQLCVIRYNHMFQYNYNRKYWLGKLKNNIIIFNPLCTHGFFPLVWYNKLGII